jgi:pyridoxine 4-dehydrogenase
MRYVELGHSGLKVSRICFGSWQFGGDWGSVERDDAIAAVRAALDQGVTFFDTAQAYGFGASEALLAEALGDDIQRDDVVVATKGGLRRAGDAIERDSSPAFLRAGVEQSLRHLGVEAIDLYQVHWPDHDTPFEETGAALRELKDEGKIRHVGVSNVSVDELERARTVVEVVTVQNRYNLTDRQSESVLEACERDGIGFIPWFPLAIGELARPGGPLDDLARRHDGAPGQLALAWLLARSPVVVPIPGTASLAHLEENVAAASLDLSADELRELAATA